MIPRDDCRNSISLTNLQYVGITQLIPMACFALLHHSTTSFMNRHIYISTQSDGYIGGVDRVERISEPRSRMVSNSSATSVVVAQTIVNIVKSSLCELGY